jgi:catechol 2,3-dioxygenase-like lactoylglutathione lyase family enzyme
MQSPIKTRKVSHVVFNVSDMERSIRFYELLGFRLSDRNERGMAFMRHGTDHHTIAFAPAPAGATPPPKDKYVTFHHVALEVDNVDELFKAREFLQGQGVEIEFEGRRGPGCNVGIEFRDPDGYAVELTCEMDQIGWNETARPHSQHRAAKSLEEAVANPLDVVEPGLPEFAFRS